MDFRGRFLEGVERFNRQRFWDAHEAWEELWLAAGSDLVRFLQGLIQLAAAYHHVQRGTLSGAARLFDAALEKLAAFPPVYCGIDRSNAVAAAARHRDAIRSGAAFACHDYPSLVLADERDSPIPPVENW
ncbi:MAG TPA: DUF309 domain-containing protein [Thermoanaerobaculia bacterium]|nr:DUF309 domain-containing protein [Thermoanaerobaculia bacterium]